MIVRALIPIHGREAVVRRCAEALRHTADQSAVTLSVTYIGNEDWAERMAEDYNAQWVRSVNNPLGMKLNRGLAEALTYDFDYLMPLGSDNIISPSLFDIYQPYMDKGFGLIGIDKCYFYDQSAQRVKLVDYQLTPVAGRVISRDAIESTATNIYKVQILNSIAGVSYSYSVDQVVYMPATAAEALARAGHCHIISKGHVHLWDERDNALDHNSNMRLIFNGIKNKCINTGDVPYLIDLKTDENIWKYDDIKGVDYPVKHIRGCMQDHLMSV